MGVGFSINKKLWYCDKRKIDIYLLFGNQCIKQIISQMNRVTTASLQMVTRNVLIPLVNWNICLTCKGNKIPSGWKQTRNNTANTLPHERDLGCFNFSSDFIVNFSEEKLEATDESPRKKNILHLKQTSPKCTDCIPKYMNYQNV